MHTPSVKKSIKKFVRKITQKSLNRSFGANDDFEIRQVPAEIRLGSRDDLSFAQAKVWRHQVDQFCDELDKTAVQLKRRRGLFQQIKSRNIVASDTLENIRLQTRVYRDELHDLKSEAQFLKDERNSLIEEMHKIGAQDKVGKALAKPRRRKSIATPYRVC